MENTNVMDMSESIKPVVGFDVGTMTRQQRRQAKRDEEKHLREQAFAANQKVTRTEMQQLVNAVVGLAKEVSDCKGFVSNIFFALDHKGIITLKEMDEVARLRERELKEYTEITRNNDASLVEKIEIAKQKGLSQIFIDMLLASE